MFEKESLRKCKDMLDLGGSVTLDGYKVAKCERNRWGESGFRFYLIRTNPFGGIDTFLLNATNWEVFVEKVEKYFLDLKKEEGIKCLKKKA